MDTNTTDQTTPPVTPTSEAPGGQAPHKNTGMAIVAYLIFFLPLLTEAKDDPYVKYHVNQGFVLFLVWLAVSILSWIPPIMFVGWILHLGLLVFLVIGILNAAQGKEEPLPLIGQFASHFHL
jgi:uncharacterized membrane protein